MKRRRALKWFGGSVLAFWLFGLWTPERETTLEDVHTCAMIHAQNDIIQTLGIIPTWSTHVIGDPRWGQAVVKSLGNGYAEVNDMMRVGEQWRWYRAVLKYPPRIRKYEEISVVEFAWGR